MLMLFFSFFFFSLFFLLHSHNVLFSVKDLLASIKSLRMEKILRASLDMFFKISLLDEGSGFIGIIMRSYKFYGSNVSEFCFLNVFDEV